MSERAKEAKGWFCTWPKCTLTKEEALDILKGKEELVEWVIASETHKDGTPHLHAFLKLAKKRQFKVDRFDLGEWHGNYQIAKSWKAVAQYCKKDGDYISNIDVESAQAKKGKRNKLLLTEDPVELVDSGQISLLQLKSLIQNRELYLSLKRQRDNVEEGDYPKQKKRHIWIWGPPDSGKTTKQKEILAEFEGNTFQIPYNNDWQGYKGERILWADEYKGQLTIQELNRICDGGAKVNTKGSTVTLHPYPQVILASNFDPSGCYHKADREILETVKNRFDVMVWNWKDHVNN